MTLDARDGRRGIGALLRELAEGSGKLVGNEIRLAKVEVGDLIARIGRGTALIAAGGVFVLIGALSTITGIVLLAGDQWLPADLYWVGALIVFAIAGGLAAWFAKQGLAIMSPSEIAPRETVTTLKEDTEWVKQQLTSGATSN